MAQWQRYLTPHEIANVFGVAGVEFMVANASQTRFKITFGVPSCVAATEFETAGAAIAIEDMRQLFQENDIWRC